MPPSDASFNGGILSFTIKAGGSAIRDTLQCHSIEIFSSANRIPSARITLLDGEMNDGTFPASDADDFTPGTAMEILAGYDSDETSVFGGIIVKHGISVDAGGASRLVIECRDKAIKMTVGRKNVNFLKKKDSEIIKTLITGNSCTAEVTATTTVFEEMVQYCATDWDFMLTRAEMNGYIVTVDNGKVTAATPSTADKELFTVTYGVDLMEFNATVNAVSQLKKVCCVGWDLQKQEIAKSNGQDPGWEDQGNIGRTELAKTASPDTLTITGAAVRDAATLKQWADARMVKGNLAKIRGSVKFPGNAAVKPGKVIKLKGVGARFEGKVLVTGVTHDMRDNNWTTECTFGLSDEWFSSTAGVSGHAASNYLPGVSGLQIGKVKKLDGDPLEQCRIQVSLPLLQHESDGTWARLAQLYGTNGAGSFFIPEVDDEVIVGFFNDDPTQPVILGSMYSGKAAPPYTIAAENGKKALVSKEKLTIEFDDENKVLTLSTPGGNTVVLSDKDKKITVTDQNSNSIGLSESGISIESAKDITIKAKGKISLTATGALALKSTADATIKGSNVSVNADVGVAVKGSATAELSASGQTTVKGAMVMIN